MKKNKKVIDADTQALMRDGEALKDLCQSAGWQIVRTRFIKKIGELLNINATRSEERRVGKECRL